MQRQGSFDDSEPESESESDAGSEVGGGSRSSSGSGLSSGSADNGAAEDGAYLKTLSVCTYLRTCAAHAGHACANNTGVAFPAFVELHTLCRTILHSAQARNIHLQILDCHNSFITQAVSITCDPLPDSPTGGG